MPTSENHSRNDLHDSNKLGDVLTQVERSGNLITIFENPALDFSKNRAKRDILDDAYEYLMRHFASQSGKGKGKFYTPSKVSRIIAKVIGTLSQNDKSSTTTYDLTCRPGFLLFRIGAVLREMETLGVTCSSDKHQREPLLATKQANDCHFR